MQAVKEIPHGNGNINVLKLGETFRGYNCRRRGATWRTPRARSATVSTQTLTCAAKAIQFLYGNLCPEISTRAEAH